MEVTDKIKRIISDELGWAKDEIKPEDTIVDDLGADDLDQMELVMALEEEFVIAISDKDADGLTTVQQMIDYVVKATADPSEATATSTQ